MRIYKYHIKLADGEIKVELPETAKILCVDMQEQQPTLWAIVDPDEPLKEYTFLLLATGDEVPEGLTRYLGTCFMRTVVPGYPNGFVWHVFQKCR